MSAAMEPAAAAPTSEDATAAAAGNPSSAGAADAPMPRGRRGSPLGSKKKPAPAASDSDANPGAAGEGTGTGGPEGEATAAVEQEKQQVSGKRRRGRPKGSKNKPKQVAGDGARAKRGPAMPMDAEAGVPRSDLDATALAAANAENAEAAAAVTTPRRGRPKGSKNKSKGPGDRARATGDVKRRRLDVPLKDSTLKAIHLKPTDLALFEAWKLSLQGAVPRYEGSCSKWSALNQQAIPEDVYRVGNEGIDPDQAIQDEGNRNQDNIEDDRNPTTWLKAWLRRMEQHEEPNIGPERQTYGGSENCTGEANQADDDQCLLTTVDRLAGILPPPEVNIRRPPQWAVDVMLGASVELMMEELEGAARFDFTGFPQTTGRQKWMHPDIRPGAQT